MTLIHFKSNDKNAGVLNLNPYKSDDEYHLVSTQETIKIEAVPTGIKLTATNKKLIINSNLQGCSIKAKEIIIEGSIERTTIVAENITINGKIKGSETKNNLTGVKIILNNNEIANHEHAIITHQANPIAKTNNNSGATHRPSLFTPKPSKTKLIDTTETNMGSPFKKLRISNTSPSNPANLFPIHPGGYFKYAISRPVINWKEKTEQLKLADSKDLEDAAINEGVKYLRSQLEKFLKQTQAGQQPEYSVNGKIIKVRFFQLRALVEYYNGLMANNFYPVFELPTGIGKTFIFTFILHHLLTPTRATSNKFRCLITTSNINTIEQIPKEMQKYAGKDIKTAIYHSGKHQSIDGSDVFVTTPLALILDQKERKERKEQAKKFDYKDNKFRLIIWDEAHLGLSLARQNEIQKQMQPDSHVKQILAYSATPFYNQYKNVYKAMGYENATDKRNPITPVTVYEAISQGELSPVTTFLVVPEIQPKDRDDLENLLDRNQDEEQVTQEVADKISKIINTEPYNHLVAKVYFTAQNTVTNQYFLQDKAIIFAINIEHAINLERTFNEYEPGCAKAVHSKLSLKDNEIIRAEHRDKKFKVLINVASLAQGHDDPEVSTILNVSPTKSQVFERQRDGRALRWQEGKIANIINFYWGTAGEKLFKNIIENNYKLGLPENFVPPPPNKIPSETFKNKFTKSAKFDFVNEDSQFIKLRKSLGINSIPVGKNSAPLLTNRFELLKKTLTELEQLFVPFKEKLSNLNLASIDFQSFTKKNPASNKNMSKGNKTKTTPMEIDLTGVSDFDLESINTRAENLRQAIDEILDALIPEQDEKSEDNALDSQNSTSTNPPRQAKDKLSKVLSRVQRSAASITALFGQLKVGVSLNSSNTLSSYSNSSTTINEEDLDQLLTYVIEYTQELKTKLETNSNLILESIAKKSAEKNPENNLPTTSSSINDPEETHAINANSNNSSLTTTIHVSQDNLALENINLVMSLFNVSASELENDIPRLEIIQCYNIEDLVIFDIVNKNTTSNNSNFSNQKAYWFPKGQKPTQFSAIMSPGTQHNRLGSTDKSNHNYYKVIFNVHDALQELTYVLSNFEQVIFFKSSIAQFVRCKFQDVMFYRTSDYPKIDLNNSDLASVRFIDTPVAIVQSRLATVKFEASACRQLTLRNSSLVFTTFKGEFELLLDNLTCGTSTYFSIIANEKSHIKNSNFSYQSFRNSSLSGKIENSNFCNVDFNGVSFKNIKLEKCNFKGAKLDNTMWQNFEIINCHFDDLFIPYEKNSSKIQFHDCFYASQLLDTPQATVPSQNAFSPALPPISKSPARTEGNTYEMLEDILGLTVAENHKFSVNDVVNYDSKIKNIRNVTNAPPYWFPNGTKPTRICEINKNYQSTNGSHSFGHSMHKHYYYNVNFTNLTSLRVNHYNQSHFENVKISNSNIGKFSHCTWSSVFFHSLENKKPWDTLTFEDCNLSSCMISGNVNLHIIGIRKSVNPLSPSDNNIFSLTSHNTYITNGYLIGDNFSNSKLYMVGFTNNAFNDAIFSKVIFEINYIERCNFSEAQFENALFTRVNPEITIATQAAIKNSNFSKANLKKATFSHITLSDVDFSGADLKDSIWKNVSFNNCIFSTDEGLSKTVTFSGRLYGEIIIFDNITSFINAIKNSKESNEDPTYVALPITFS